MNPREDGHAAAEDNRLMAEGTFDAQNQYTLLRLPDGRVMRLPTAILLLQGQQPDPLAGVEVDEGTFTLPLIEERLAIEKRIGSTGKVVLERHVHEYQEQLDVPLAMRTFEIERVVLNQPVDAAPSVRTEGNTVIYPIVEERLVLTTQLILKEELRVIQIDSERRDTRTVTLKREHIEVVRSNGVES